MNNFHQHFFGVCDGHGALGRDVSTYVKNRLPGIVLIIKVLIQNELRASGEIVSTLSSSFLNCHKELARQSFDTMLRLVDLLLCSGTTCVTAFFTGSKLFIANSGDSRCIICSHNGDGLTVE
jgi:serine/threonine protein phosphatase PrpC